MTVANPIFIKSESLFQQLRGLKFIVDEGQDVLNQNPFSKEFLAFKIDIVHNLIQELQLWEGLGNQSKCNSVFDDAQFFLKQAEILMDRILDDECEKAWSDYQKELRFTNHASIDYEYVLGNTIKTHPGCVAG